MLGERFSYISTNEIELAKGQRRSSADLPKTRLTFFSYSNNVAVNTYLQGANVTEVRTKEAYQPPEGLDEIKVAVTLARQDGRLSGFVQNLEANAIVTFPQKDQPGFGHRGYSEDEPWPFNAGELGYDNMRIFKKRMWCFGMLHTSIIRIQALPTNGIMLGLNSAFTGDKRFADSEFPFDRAWLRAD